MASSLLTSFEEYSPCLLFERERELIHCSVILAHAGIQSLPYIPGFPIKSGMTRRLLTYRFEEYFLWYSLLAMINPEGSPGILARAAALARAVNEQLRPQPGQPFPFQRTTLKEDLGRIERLSGPPRRLGEYITDFAAAVDGVRNHWWPPRP